VVIVNASGINAPGRVEFHPANNPQGRLSGLSEPRWIVGIIKNIGVIAILVTAIVWPKSIVRKREERPE